MLYQGALWQEQAYRFTASEFGARHVPSRHGKDADRVMPGRQM